MPALSRREILMNNDVRCPILKTPAMKTHFCHLLALLLTTSTALSWSGPISRPEYYAPRGCPPEAMDRVSKALNHPDCKFLTGRFFSLSASWECSGNTFALNAFLKGLSECPGVRLHISKMGKDYHGTGDWSVYTHMDKEHFIFHIKINLKSERIVADAVKLPALKGPSLSLFHKRLAFSERLKLSDDQESLLKHKRRAAKKRNEAIDAGDHNRNVHNLISKLCSFGNVRNAKAKELIVERTDQKTVSIIYNPTKENLVFDVAIKGEEKLRGSTFMSVAHETWLPPHGRLFVTNMYWTTPSMRRADNK